MKNMCDTINEWDVLFGRGGKSNTHRGNRRFRAMIVQSQAEYLNARKKDKILIAQRIVRAVQSHGGRFLMRAGVNREHWGEVSDERAIAKTSQGLREGLDVRRKQLRPTKCFKHIEDDTDSVKRSFIRGKVITTRRTRDVSPDQTPMNSPLGPRPMAVPSHISFLSMDRIDCGFPELSDNSEDYCIDVMPRLGIDLQHVFDM